MIKVRCRTNVDDYKFLDWPEEMACRPLRGDAVVNKNGRILYVVGVTHAVGKDSELDTEMVGKPYLIVELHKYYPGLDTCRAK